MIGLISAFLGVFGDPFPLAFEATGFLAVVVAEPLSVFDKIFAHALGTIIGLWHAG